MVTEIRCSQLARPMACPGFTAFENLPESEEGMPAKEGTACGELLAWRLTRPTEPLLAQASNGIYIDGDMRFYTQPIAAEIMGNVQGDIRCEQRIDWRTRSGIWIRGSYDISFVRNGALYIDDLKYGWGIIEVKPSWQLLGYAIGEVIRRQTAFKQIVLRIHQPRPHHEDGPTRQWVMTYEELLGYKEQIEQRMDEISAGVKDLNTGKQCKYCEATAEACPAFNRMFYRSMEVSTQFTQDYINEEELSRQLDQANRAQEVLKIKVDSLKNLAVARIKSGKLIPGYVTESNYGDRKWKGNISPDVIEALTGIPIVEKQMLSPAKAEKLGVAKEVVNALVDRHFIGQKLVRRDAKDIGNKIFGTEAPR